MIVGLFRRGKSKTNLKLKKKMNPIFHKIFLYILILIELALFWYPCDPLFKNGLIFVDAVNSH